MKDEGAAARREQYDEYARTTPYFFSQWAYPQNLYRELTHGSGTYVEIGAGDGTKLQSLLADKALTRYSRIIATDISSTRISHIQRYLQGIEAFTGDAMALPLPDQSADFCFSDQVIEHVPDDRAMAREIRRILRPGGKAFVGSVLKLPGAWYFYRNGGQWRIDPTHVREYSSESEYVQVFTDAGLVVDRVEVSPIAFPLTDLFIRALVRTNVSDVENVHKIYDRSPLLRALCKLRINVPRYRIVSAYLHREPS
jgi:SAM-dependent methyltransferase